MRASRIRQWVWFAVLAAIVVGLFAPTMVARAGDPGTTEELKGCPVPIAR